MPKKIFLSYSHAQQEWVRTRLVPVLEAGGAEVLIDYREFGAGRTLPGQMDATQDKADTNLLVISPAYLDSANCRHEMERAVARDPGFLKDPPLTIPVICEKVHDHPHCPGWLVQNLPLWLDLSDDRAPDPWERLMKACDANLGVTVPDWLNARDEICRCLERNQSVNLVVREKYIKWRELLRHIRQERFTDLGEVDVESGSVASRRAFVAEMLKAAGVPRNVPAEPEDLVVLNNAIAQRSQKTRLILKHFDYVTFHPYYDHNLFSALRHLIMDSQKLVLLIHSKKSFAELLPPDNPLSSITNLKTVELQAKP